MHARSLYAALFREFLQAVVVKVQADFNIFVEFGPSREHTKHGWLTIQLGNLLRGM